MRNNIKNNINKYKKKIFAVIMTVTLMGDLLQLPGSMAQADAKEINHADNAYSENTVSGNTAVLDNDMNNVEEEQPKEQIRKEQEETADNKAGAEHSETLSDLPNAWENDAVSKMLHIGQTTDMDDIPCPDDSIDTYDMPIVLTESSKVRLFVNWSIADGALTWSVLRGEAGMKPGTANIVNDKDDWTDFETVPFSPNFIMQEEEDEDSVFYKTLTITAGSLETDNNYDYYIRATFRYTKDQTECTAITTVPVRVSAIEEDVDLTEALTGGEQTLTETDGEAVIDGDLGTTKADQDDAITEADEGLTASAEMEDGQNDAAAYVIEDDSMADTDQSVMGSVMAAGEKTDDPAEIQEGNGEDDQDKSSADIIGISKMSLNRTSATMNPGDTLQLSVTIVPERLNPDISWVSSNYEIVSVDHDGMVTAVAEGTAEITAQCEGKTVGIKINVVQTDADKNSDQPVDKEGNPIAISDEVWIAGFERESDALTYTGGKITQDLRIYHKGTLLKEKTDYTLTYKNNTNAAAYNAAKAPSVTVTMKGQYSGSRTLYFTIKPREIDENDSLGYEQVIQYAKTLKIPAPTLYFGSKKLVSNKDFVCDYSSLPQNYTKGDSYEDGVSYEYSVKGTGNFTGSFTMKLAVIRDKNLNLGSAVITVDKKQYEYHGEALSEADVRITSVKLGKTVLDDSLYEYEVYAEGVGTGYIEVRPSDAGREAGYRGVKKLNIKVVGDRNIKNTGLGNDWQDAITFSQKEINDNGGIYQKKEGVLVYSGENGSESLTEGVDYTVKYSNYKKIGTATVTFTGKGRYTGSLKKTYKITANTELYIKWHNTDATGAPVASYRKGGAIPQFELLELSDSDGSCVLSSKTDYTVKLKNNNKLGTMTCEITGKGNYKGYKSITQVEVIAADISQGTISIPDKQYSSKGNAWKSAVTLKDVNGKKLTAGTDYDKNLIYSYDKMEDGLPPQAGTIVYVTVLGLNNYEGSSVTGSYRIYSTSISKLTVVIDAQEYTGREIELSADAIHVYASKNEVKKGVEIAEPCYAIVSYSNNIKAGTAKVTLRGIGAYGGTRTCSFKINKKKYLTTRVTKLLLDETSIRLGPGDARQLTATVLPEDAWNQTVIWTSSNNKIATVSKQGVVTAIKSGKATVTAASQDTGKKATCKITVSVIPVTSFSLNTKEIRQEEGTTYQLEATEILPEDATYSTIQWESSNSEIASVDANGLVYLNKAGMAVITAYTAGRKCTDKCLVFVEKEEDNTAPEGDYVTPQEYRRVDDVDDTAAFNRAIQSFEGKYETLYVPAGTYLINAETGIRLAGRMQLIMSPDAVIKAVGNSSEHYDVILVKEVSQVTISGGRIVGERYEHTGKKGEWGHGIGVYDCSVITIKDVDISECWGDGIYLGTNRTDANTNREAGCGVITIENCRLHNNRRNNMSVVCADYVTVEHCTFNYAGGTAPEYGIDIETNFSNNPCEHITISDSTFDGNGQGSIGIIQPANDVRIENCTLNGAFINYAGTNVVISKSDINGETDARIGIILEDEVKINDGGSEEDVLIASFSAADLDAVEGQYTLGEYGVNAANRMAWSVIDDSDASLGKALLLERQTEGTQDAGYYLNLSEMTDGRLSALTKGATYRFEYVVKGSGQWGIKTDQTGWYPCVPMSDKFSTGIVTYKAGSAKSCRLMLYAVDRTKGMRLEIDSVKIYEVR